MGAGVEAGLDVARVRGLYPSLATRTAQLDGAFASLQPESVIRAIISTLRDSPAQPGSRSSRSQHAVNRVARARAAAADLVAAEPEDVVLGATTVSLLARFATVVAADWQLGDEVVVNRLDADAVLAPWQFLARSHGAVVRWAEVDLDTGELPAWQYERLVGRRTRIVTVPLANPATGALPDVAAIAAFAHARGALVIVDAGAAPSFVPLDLAELGADAVLLSAPAFGGPTVAALVARPGLLAEMQVAVADSVHTAGLEVGPPPVELLDGFAAAVDHLAELVPRDVQRDPRAPGSRRERLVHSVTVAGEHARGLYATLDSELRALPGVTVLGGPERAVPVVAFTVAGRTPDQVGAFLQRHDVSVWTGDPGVTEVLRAFGADDVGGVCFAGLMPHSTPAEIRQLVAALRRLA